MAISNSIVDYLKSTGQDSSYAARKRLASQTGISGYSGTASQNQALLRALRAGSSAASPSASASSNAGSTALPAQKSVNSSYYSQYSTGSSGTGNGGSGEAAGVGPGYTGSSSSSSSSTTYTRQYEPSARTNAAYSALMAKQAAMPDDYEESDYVIDRRNKLADVEAQKPDAFKSKYQTQIDDLLNQIYSDKGFSYTAKDLQNDDLYKMYAQQYADSANRAMRDTMGNAQAQSGGYGSTYAQQAGQQAYDQTMSQLNDRVLDFYDRAFQKYQNNQANRYNQLGTFQTQDNTDYGRYRDTVSDWQADRAYYLGALQGEQANDLNIYNANNSNYYNGLNYLASRYDQENANDLNDRQFAITDKQAQYQNMLNEQALQKGGIENALAQDKYDEYMKLRQKGYTVAQANNILAGKNPDGTKIGSGGSGGGRKSKSSGSSGGNGFYYDYVNSYTLKDRSGYNNGKTSASNLSSTVKNSGNRQMMLNVLDNLSDAEQDKKLEQWMNHGWGSIAPNTEGNKTSKWKNDSERKITTADAAYLKWLANK